MVQRHFLVWYGRAFLLSNRRAGDRNVRKNKENLVTRPSSTNPSFLRISSGAWLIIDTSKEQETYTTLTRPIA